MNIPPPLCEELSQILNAEIASLFNQNLDCILVNYRTFPATILNRPTTEPLNNLFTFQATPLKNKTLNIGWFSLLETEVTSVVGLLSKQGITVSSIADFSPFLNPRIIRVYYQVLENPLRTATKLKNVLSSLKNTAKSLSEPEPTPQFRILCDTFAQTLGTNSVLILGSSCEVFKIRDLHLKIEGQKVITNPPRLINLSFESLDASANALCWGQIDLLKREVSTFLNVLKKQKGIIISSLHIQWFTNPQTVELTYLTVENPITFAIQSRRALKVLT
ncbi:DUF1259 domain-containing protein [Hazenella sp. IB182353]|uniref:DUF1259 domain-containing protein n=1 Tax=Polycladospora coralii TaxID=2771432 RepID=UPI001747B362|nr:DUF1259 domain-containing protein [Polycladospora coralii]MBS7532013.1 DUF1259 domain-containing protein [Polycladospora coralii]